MSNISARNQIIKGAINVQSPLVLNSLNSVAHGLGVAPTFCLVVLRCIVADQGYSVGEEINMPFGSIAGGANFYTVSHDTVYTHIIILSSSAPTVPNKTTRGNVSLTLASWEIVVTPVRVL